MIHNVRRPLATALCLLTLLIVALPALAWSLDRELARRHDAQGMSAQAKRNSRSLDPEQSKRISWTLDSGQSKRNSSLVSDLFTTNCARCHGADGRGDTPLGETFNAPDFTDAEWWRKNSKITGSTALVSIVTRGKGQMPAFGKKLTRKQIRLLVSHVR